MPNRGDALLQKARRVVAPDGYVLLYNSFGRCADCCTPRVRASKITNESSPIWNLTGLKKFGKECAFWRLIETGICFPTAYPWYGAGKIDGSGQLIGLPDSFESAFPHDGFMELQIGCVDSANITITWPGSCRTTSPRANFPP